MINLKGISKNHSNRRAYNWLAYQTSDRCLAKYAPLCKGVVYDLGAGEAPYKEFVLQYAEKYIAVDWAGSCHQTRADIIADLNHSLPIDSTVADSVMSISALEHLCEPQLMLNEAFRILKPGGAIVLQVPWQWWIHEAPYDYFRFTPYGLDYMFRKAGFVDIVTEPQAGLFTTIVLKLNYFSIRLIRGPRLMRWFLTALLTPWWIIGQVIAPMLDKLDRSWELETAGYFVTAKKP